MSAVNPQIPRELHEVEDFFTYGKNLLSNDDVVEEIRAADQQLHGKDFFKLEIKSSIFKNSRFTECNFASGAFFDIEFTSCDFSNSKFSGAYFSRCKFVGCKCIGMDMSETIVKESAFEGCDLSYSSFDEAKLTDVGFNSVNFSDGTMADAKLKRFSAVNSKFLRNNFFKTLLNGVDFTENEITAPILSNPPIELHGAVLNMFQAADLIRLWGVIVKP
ncbi:MAG: pentapeptide repeat-containing protein [Oscillospiraceae bacterium]